MNPQISTRHSKGVFEDCHLHQDIGNPDSLFLKSWELRLDVGFGSFQKAELHSGMDLHYSYCKSKKPFVVRVEANEEATFGFSFYVSGTAKNKFSCLKDDFVTGTGQSGLFFTPDISGSAEILAAEPLVAFSIQMTKQFFYTLIKRELDRIPSCIQSVFEKSKNEPFHYISTISPSMQIALHQIRNCPYKGLTKRLYLESRALELIAYKLDECKAGETRNSKVVILRPNVLEGVHYVRELLEKDLENPPTLLDIAKAVEWSHTKLNYCFRAVYGTSVFGYLRDMRLNKAKNLLNEGKMSVTEVAYAIGYNSLSHFAVAFKRCFGVAPGNYLREVTGRKQ
jgi:AraC-like DNA-binding protein